MCSILFGPNFNWFQILSDFYGNPDEIKNENYFTLVLYIKYLWMTLIKYNL